MSNKEFLKKRIDSKINKTIRHCYSTCFGWGEWHDKFQLLVDDKIIVSYKLYTYKKIFTTSTIIKYKVPEEAGGKTIRKIIATYSS